MRCMGFARGGRGRGGRPSHIQHYGLGRTLKPLTAACAAARLGRGPQTACVSLEGLATGAHPHDRGAQAGLRQALLAEEAALLALRQGRCAAAASWAAEFWEAICTGAKQVENRCSLVLSAALPHAPPGGGLWAGAQQALAAGANTGTCAAGSSDFQAAGTAWLRSPRAAEAAASEQTQTSDFMCTRLLREAQKLSEREARAHFGSAVPLWRMWRAFGLGPGAGECFWCLAVRELPVEPLWARASRR